MSDQPPTSIWQRIDARLRENPLLLVYGGAAGFAVLVVTVVLVLLLATGGGDGGETVSGDPTGQSPSPTATATPPATSTVTPSASPTSTPTATPDAPLPAVSNVAPALDIFGILAVVHSQPITVAFGSAPDALLLPDGVAIDVPGDAFSVPAELGVVMVDLLIENYLINAPQTRIYVISAADGVFLSVPLVLVVPVSTSLVTVTEYVGGEWVPLEVAPGITTRIEIGHLSERTIAVSQESFGAPQIPLNAPAPAGYSPRESLTSCINLFMNQPQFIGGSSESVLYVCWQSLEKILEPAPDEDVVDIACLSAQIEGSSLTEEAIAVCSSPFAEPTPSPTPTETPTPTATPLPQTGILAPGEITVEPVLESCVQPADDEPIQCSYTLHVSTDYEVSALPAQIECRIRNQIPAFSPLESDTADLSQVSGQVTISPRAVAQFDPPDTPRFSLPTLVECFLQVPQAGGTVRNLDSALVEVHLPPPEL